MDDFIVVEVIESKGFLDQFQLVSILMENQNDMTNGPGIAYYMKNGEQYSLRTTR